MSFITLRDGLTLHRNAQSWRVSLYGRFHREDRGSMTSGQQGESWINVVNLVAHRLWQKNLVT